MKVRLALVALCALLVAGAPAGTAAPSPEAPVEAAACAAASPPCGYIVPQITLDFPDKPACRAKTLGGPIELADCLALPAVGATTVQDGVMRFSWDVTQDGTYPPDPNCAVPPTACITISFTGTATNPKWMRLVVEPAEVVLDAAAFADPNNYVVNEDPQQVVFLVEVPLRVTFERLEAGDDDRSVQRVERAQGAVQMFLKAKSSASGQYYKEAFGVEEFRFNPCANDDALRTTVAQCNGQPLADGTTPPQAGEDTPGLGLLGALGAVAAVGVVLRRRRA